MPSSLWLTLVAPITLIGCLSTPDPNASDAGGAADGGTNIDASRFDAGDLADATPVSPDAMPVGPGTAFPPVMTAISITGAWSGDLNGDQLDDVVLMSDTGDSATAGVYVLLGQMGVGVPDFHQFLSSGTEAPLAVTATQLDGAGTLDIVVYDVYHDTVDAADSLAYLRAYLGAGAAFTEPPVQNHITATQADDWKPRTLGTPVQMVAARLDADATAPGFAVAHQRGAFFLPIPAWSTFTWEQAAPQVLLAEGSSGLGLVPNATNPVDDLIVWTDQAAEVRLMVNDGHASFARTNVNATPPAPAEAALYDMDGVEPLDVIGYLGSGIQAIAVDDDVTTTGAFLNGLTYIPDMGNFREIQVFDTNEPGIDERPEIIVASPDCDGGTVDPCLLMIRNAYIDEPSGELRTDQAWTRYFLPAGFVPEALVRGDFDGDANPELIIFSADGSQDCVRVANATFAPCD